MSEMGVATEVVIDAGESLARHSAHAAANRMRQAHRQREAQRQQAKEQGQQQPSRGMGR